MKSKKKYPTVETVPKSTPLPPKRSWELDTQRSKSIQPKSPKVTHVYYSKFHVFMAMKSKTNNITLSKQFQNSVEKL